MRFASSVDCTHICDCTWVEQVDWFLWWTSISNSMELWLILSRRRSFFQSRTQVGVTTFWRVRAQNPSKIRKSKSLIFHDRLGLDEALSQFSRRRHSVQSKLLSHGLVGKIQPSWCMFGTSNLTPRCRSCLLHYFLVAAGRVRDVAWGPTIMHHERFSEREKLQNHEKIYILVFSNTLLVVCSYR